MRIQRPAFLIGIGWMTVWLAGVEAAEDKASGNSSLKIDDKRLMEVSRERPDGEDRGGPVQADGPGREQIVDELVLENENLRKKVLALKREMSKLSLSFSALRSRHRRMGLEFEPESRKVELGMDSSAANVREVLPVLDANPDLGMVVLGAGLLEGLNPGLIYRVVRDGEVIASLRVVVVRRLIAGAKVLDEGKRSFPAVGDKAVLGRARKRNN